LTVLGKYGPWPKARCACSGYLLEAGGKRLLLDCGCGVLGSLQRYCPIDKLDGIILSHLHSDHMGDMLVLRYALPYFLGKGLMKAPLPVFLPGTPENVAETILSDGSFDAKVVKGGDAFDFMGLRLSFFPVRHPVECNAVRFEFEGRTFVFSGDMNTTPGFEKFAASADLLLIDGSFPKADWAEDKPHLSAALAAETGLKAKAGRVLITHLRPIDDEAVLLREAQEANPDAELAQEGFGYVV
jgi:ribonuclease BN (tRNA processing enzyme)